MPLERVLGAELGAVYRDIHADHGVRMLLGTGVEAFEGAGAVERVRTGDGQALDCDFVVVGIGVQPRTELAEQAGLAVDDGVLVDEQLRTSAPDVFAAGDVANEHAPVLRRAHPRRALGERAAPGAGRRARHARPPRSPTTACRTSSPISTTSGWSTPGHARDVGPGRRSAAIPRAASSSRSGSSATAWSPA